MAKDKTIKGLRITLVEDYDEMCSLAVASILDRLQSNPRLNMLVPTGTTPLGVYQKLCRQNSAPIKKAGIFNMDEYCVTVDGKYELVPEMDSVSYRRYMRENLYCSLTPAKSYFPGVENIQKPGTYDEFIKKSGGIDLCLNAIGEDGHTFGFNLPGTPFDSKTRLVVLSDETKKVNQGLTGLNTPGYAITIGLMTGMESQEILLLVSGKRKADIFKKIIDAPQPTMDIPATILKQHSNCHWIVDKDAAARL